MNLKRNLFQRLRLYAVIDKEFRAFNIIIKKGITCVQVREKNSASFLMIKKIKTIRKRLSQHKIPIIINDRPDVASAVKASGLHVGRGDMPLKVLKKILDKSVVIGKTVRNAKQAKIAEREGADYISLGPIFKTPFKKELTPRGLSLLKKIKRCVDVPIVAIGGINFGNIDRILSAGADGVAMMRGIKDDSN